MLPRLHAHNGQVMMCTTGRADEQYIYVIAGHSHGSILNPIRPGKIGQLSSPFLALIANQRDPGVFNLLNSCDVDLGHISGPDYGDIYFGHLSFQGDLFRTIKYYNKLVIILLLEGYPGG
jgi:hypothetical protein